MPRSPLPIAALLLVAPFAASAQTQTGSPLPAFHPQPGRPAAAPAPQPPIGTVEASAATVSGLLSVSDGHDLVGSNAVITARDRTARLQLSRGGEILVCTTSSLHAARSPGPNEPAPLLLALDRGALELHMVSTSRDAILTPDLRITLAAPGPGLTAAGLLDLRLRVTSNGDTCVENRGPSAPTLEVNELFGSALYLIRPGQHLLFEHGSLREVVDHETSPCGCPAPPVLSVASNGISTDLPKAAVPHARVADDPEEVHPPTDVASQYPFPAAESQGLTPSTNVARNAEPGATPNETRTQLAATLSFNPGTATQPIASATPTDQRNAVPAPPPAPGTAATPPSAAASTPAVATTRPPASTQARASTPAPRVPKPVLGLTPSPAPTSPTQAATTAPPVTVARAQPAPTPPAPKPTPSQRREPLATAAPSPNTDRYESHEVAQAPLPPAAPAPRDILHGVSHFFRHLFGRSDPHPDARPRDTAPAS